MQRMEESPESFGSTRADIYREARAHNDAAIRRELGQTGPMKDLTTALSKARQVDGKIAQTRQVLSGMEPEAVIASRLKSHSKALATKMAMKAVMAVLPPHLQVPVRLIYHAAKLGKNVSENVIQVKHKL